MQGTHERHNKPERTKDRKKERRARVEPPTLAPPGHRHQLPPLPRISTQFGEKAYPLQETEPRWLLRLPRGKKDCEARWKAAHAPAEVNEKSRPRGQASVAASTGSAQPRGSPVSPSREDVCSLRVKLRKQLAFAVDRARTAVYMQRRPARANRRTANQFGEPTRSGTPVAYKAFGSRLQQKPPTPCRYTRSGAPRSARKSASAWLEEFRGGGLGAGTD
ncbi:hypothetical protein MRX96_055049 [Rhipicephalus microplus]